MLFHCFARSAVTDFLSMLHKVVRVVVAFAGLRGCLREAAPLETERETGA